MNAQRAKTWAEINKALSVAKTTQDIQKSRPIVQLVAVAKGMIDPADLRVGATLLPEEADQAVSLIVGQDGILAKVATERMSRTTKNLNAWDVPARGLKRVAQGTDPTNGTDDTAVGDSGRSLTALPAQLFGTITLDTLRDNANNPGLPDMIAGMLYTAWRNDLTDLACNGTDDDYSGSAFLELNKGWITLAVADGSVRDVDIAPGAVAYATASTGVVASNNAITWTATQSGAAGNDIRVILSDPGQASQALAVTVSGTVVTVSLATGAGAGAITSTPALIIAAVAANGNAAALVTGANTGASTGAAAVTAASKRLEGGGITGWVDTLGAIVAASAAKYRATSEFFMSVNDALAYQIEVGKAVTGVAQIALPGVGNMLSAPINTSPYWPDGKVIYTPPSNLVVGMSVDMRRDSAYHSRKRAVEITIDGSFDFNYRVSDAVVLAV